MYAALDQHDYSDETERVKGDVPVQNSGGIHTALLHHPVIVRKGKFLKNLTWIYAVLGIAMLSVVMVLGFTSGGAKLSIEIHGITFQLSEIAKITLVFFMAGMLREDNSFGNVVKATVVAAVHVLILVASTDLGTAFVFFMAYVVVIYVATRKARYPLLGLAGMSAACVVAYFLFSHVRNRVALWQDRSETGISAAS